MHLLVSYMGFWGFGFFFFLVNLIPSDDVYTLFPYVYRNLHGYFALFFIGVSLVLVDNGLHLA